MIKEKLAIKLAIDIMERNVSKYINHGIYKVSDADGAVHVEFGEAINILNGMLEQEPCEDAISRKAVIKAVDAHTNEDGTLDDDITIILEDLPSVQPKSKTGHWIGNELGHCDNCGVEGCASDIWNNCKGDKYCPNCGAKIIDEEESK